jgi:hypothetical protein
LASEFFAERARAIDLAGALFPASSSFFEFACCGVFPTFGLACFKMAAIGLQTLTMSSQNEEEEKHHCSLLPAEEV